MTPAFTHNYADVNGVRLHYASAGTGPLMLFVHGFPEFWYAWRNLLPEFARDHHAVAPDTRGINLSSKPEGVKAYHVAQVTEDLRQLIEHLGHRRCVLVGHDWGGACAWNFAMRHPDYVERLVIVNAPHPVTFARELRRNPAQRAASEYMRLLRSPEAERLLAADDYARIAELFRGWGGGVDAATLEAYRTAWRQPGALTAALNYYRASPLRPPEPGEPPEALPDLRPQDFVVRVPTLVVWGERDAALLPALLDGLEECVPDLRIERIPEATHWVIHEFPQRVAALVRGFLAR